MFRLSLHGGQSRFVLQDSVQRHAKDREANGVRLDLFYAW